MTTPSPGSWRSLPVLALLLLGLVSSGPSLGNGFAYDDDIIVAGNESVHQLGAPWDYTQRGYWPDGGDRLYRPATIWLYALQWQAGGGSPFPFHLTNVLLYLAAIVLLYRLALRLLPEPAAWLSAALFAVHPVHVEAVGNVVGQAELNVGLTSLAAVLIYLQGRSQQEFSLARRITLALLMVWAGLAKEQGLMIPLLLVVAEATVVRDHRPWGQRVKTLVPVGLMLVVAGLAVLTLRFGAIGYGAGEEAVAIRDVTLGERALTMLAVVPHWARLLFWPHHLQADYSPMEIVTASDFGGAQLLGCLFLAAWLWGILWSWRRSRTAAFGLLWMAVAIAPVHNVLVATGIVLAERTLYLPSVGAMLVLGALAASVGRRLGAASAWQAPAIFVTALVLVAGAWLSAKRQRVWRDTTTLLAATVGDAPASYRARWQYGKHLLTLDQPEAGLAMYREAAGLYGRDPVFLEDYGHRVRVIETCAPAIPIFFQALELDEDRVIARSRLYYCLLEVDRIAEARGIAARGAELGDTAFEELVERADSLMAARPSAEG